MHIYLSVKSDSDLIWLRNKVGSRNFNALWKMALRSLTDASFDKKKWDTLLNAHSKKEEQELTPTVLHLRFTTKSDEELKKLLDSVDTDKRSFFIKTVFRQFLGPKVLCEAFINDAELLSRLQEYDMKTLVSLTANVSAKPAKKTKRKTNFSPKIQKEKEHSSPAALTEKSAQNVLQNVKPQPELEPDKPSEEPKEDVMQQVTQINVRPSTISSSPEPQYDPIPDIAPESEDTMSENDALEFMKNLGIT